MSTALTKAARLKPEIRLAQAVSEFQRDLTDAQKTEFRDGQLQARQRPPTITDVMQVTATMNLRNGVGGRCLGPRFTNFLEGVQQFAALGDIIIGGSQNLIACGVWSLVRLTLFAAVNSKTYFEKISGLFMEIGSSAPRYQSIAMLYPHVRYLQDHLHEYFILVVQLCHDMVRRSKRSAVEKLASSLSDSGLTGYKSKLDHWATMIRDDVNSAMAKTVEAERGESSRFRDSLMRFSNRQLSSHQQWQKGRVLNACSTYDHQTAWKQIRKAGVTTSFKYLSDYQAWKTNHSSSTLIYTGILGSGKSVLMANMVDDLSLHVESSKTPISYFFCRHDVQGSLQARTIIGSLTRQILSIVTLSSVDHEAAIDTKDSLDAETLLCLLQKNLKLDSNLYCVVDGLDECSLSERTDVAHFLKRMQDAFNVHVCYSLRSQPDVPLQLQDYQHYDNYTAIIPSDNPEIEKYIESELERCLESGKLTLGDHKIIIDILIALQQGAQGMFLWATLQIEVLCAMRTDDAIRQALTQLPRDLFETFSRIQQMYQGAQADYQKKLLQLIYAAYRPLTAEELREALCVVPGVATWDATKFINDVHAVIQCCGPLITVDEEEKTIRFVHFSVKQFLEAGPVASDGIMFAKQARRTMSAVTITYLCYDVFGTQLTRVNKSNKALQSAPLTIASSVFGSGSTKRELAMKLLLSRKSSAAIDVQQFVEDYSNTSPGVGSFYFHAYAEEYFHKHFDNVSEDAWLFTILRKLFVRKFRGTSIETPAPDPLLRDLRDTNKTYVEILLADPDGGWSHKISQEGLYKAARKGDDVWVSLLLETGKIDPDLEDPFDCDRTALLLAAKAGNDAVVKILLETGNVEPDKVDGYRKPPLSYAVMDGHDGVVKLLLATDKVDPDQKDPSGRTLLSWAAEYGHTAVVKLLLETGKVELDPFESFVGRTPISLAAGEGHLAVVKLLLETGKVECDSMDNNWRTPLSWAAEFGHYEVVKLLLETGQVERDFRDKRHKTALSWAEQFGHEAVVSLLRLS